MTRYITINTPDEEGREIYPVTRDSEISCTLMGDTFIKVVFNHPNIIDFKAGSFISHNQRKWSLLKNYKPESLASGNGYKYELKFYAEQHQLQRCILFWKQGDTREASFNLTTRLQDYAQLICDNINSYLATTSYGRYTTWSVGNIPAELSEKCIYQEFDGVSCWDALMDIANAFKVEWWVEDHIGSRTATLHFGRCENGNAVEFADGGIVSKMPASKRGEDAKYGTRFYVYGGTQNIPDGYYSSQDGGVTNHVSAKRLHIPLTYPTPYIDSKSNLQPNEVIEKVVILDDIFPINTETIDNVTTRTETRDGVETTYYKITCVNSPFDPSTDKLSPNIGAKFLTGSLQGREYDLIPDVDFLTTKTFEIVARNEGTGDTSIITPNKYLKPEAGDTFVLTGVKLAKDRIDEAERELLKAGQAIAQQHSADTEVYECPTNPVYCSQNNHNFQLGQRVTLVGAAFGGGRISRIQGYTKKLWNEYEATYSVGDNARYTRFGAIAVIATNIKAETAKQFQSLQNSTGRVNTELKIVANSTGNVGEIERKVGVLIGNDVDKSARAIATEVLAGASTGGDIDLSAYLSKTEAQATYATKSEVDTKINEAVRINGVELDKKADKTTVDCLSASIEGNKDVLEAMASQVEVNTEAIKDKASQSSVNSLSSSVTTLESLISSKADHTRVLALEAQIGNKVEKDTYNAKVATLEASIGGKYTKPAGGIPAKDLAAEVATETEVVNAISKAAADLNDKIDNKISKTDTLPAENVGVLSNGAKGLASTNPIIANRIPHLKADAFAFLQPEDFTVEVAYDGTTWETLDNNNADMRGMFAQLSFGTGFPIDRSNTNWQDGSKIRITLSPKVVRNAKVDFVALNVYANGRTFDILTEYYNSSSGKEGWYSVGDQLNISSNGIGFVKYNQYFSHEEYNRKGARFTFTITKNTQYWSRIVGISGYGSLSAEIIPTSSTAPHTLGTLWYWDYLKNVYFPNDIYEGGTPLKNKYASITSAIQGIESANDKYISISDVGNTLIPTKKIAIKIASIKGDEDGLVTAQDVRGSMPEIPTELPNPKPLTYKVNGVTSTYNGSSAATIQIFTPTTIGSQGQLLQSMGGGEPQWTNLSSIKEAIGFAKDLTGVLEATPEEFTFRPSAGNKSIRDEGAVIRRIKGNTVVVAQPSGTTEVQSMKVTAIETVGFNQWDEEWEVGRFDTVTGVNRESNNIRCKNLIKVLPNTVYALHVGNSRSGILAMFYDNNGNILTPIIYSDDSWTVDNLLRISSNVRYNAFITPEGTSWMKFYLEGGYGSTYTNDVSVSLFHSGIRRGEYEPYKKHILNLPEIAEYFHDGMNGIGDVYDEINSENAIKRWGSRPWQSGDDDSDDVITDGTTTIYKLSTPEITPILEPIQLVYDVEDFGTERAISPEDSAPFRADIVYQFNAEGRIRDNGRNIERLETKVNTLNHRFNGDFVVAEGLLSSNGKQFHLPSSRSENQLYNLATEQYVINNIPTEVATATQKLQANISLAGALNASPNIVYEFPSPLSVLTIETLQSPSGDYDHVWIIRFSRGQIFNITIKPTVRWKDGISPTFETNTIYELIFKQFNNQTYFGEWKAYKQ